MKIVLDARKIADYGIGVYLENLYTGLIASGELDYRIVHLQHSPELANAAAERRIVAKYKNYDLREQWEIPKRLKKLPDFFYFSPHYVFPLRIRNPFFIAIQDLIHFKFPHFFKPFWKTCAARYFIRQARDRARLIFTGSQKTREDLVEMFSFKPEQIQVIPYGISPAFFDFPQQPSPYSFPYILCSGNPKPHKNLQILIRSFARISGQFPDLKLVLAGGKGGMPHPELINQLKIPDRVVFPGFLPLAELIAVIDGAACFVFPSLYEGFGFPPLEAMARTRPVLSSRAGSLPEVLGPHAWFFDPCSEEDLADKLVQVLGHPARAQETAQKGRQHSLAFKWEKTVHSYLKIFENII